MIYLACALYKEAEQYIKTYGLKPLDRNVGYQVYTEGELTVIVTGVGALKAAIALTDYFAVNMPGEGDVVALIGSAGLLRGEHSDSLYLAHTLYDATTDRIVHPDLVGDYSTFKLASLITFPKVVTRGTEIPTLPSLPEVTNTVLCDMESYGVYLALIRFFKSSKIFVIKFISDDVSENSGYDLSNAQAEKVMAYLKANHSASNGPSRTSADTLATLLGASKTMTHTIYQYADYYAACGGDVDRLIGDFIAEQELVAPVCKRDGNKLLERFKEIIMTSVSI